MALLHHQSCESVHTGLDLFSVPPTQTAVESGHFIEIYPLSAVSPGAPIEFSISGASEEYLDLSNTFLHVKAKVTKPNGADLDAGTDVAPVNNWMHSLFTQVDIALNDVLISASENTYPYRAYLESTLNFSNEAKTSHLTSVLYYKDTAGHLDATQGDDNLGLKVRRELAAQSSSIDMMGRLHTDITHQDKYMLPGVDVKIRLIPSRNLFNLIAHNANGQFQSVIQHCSLFVRKVKLNPAVSLAHEKALEKATAKYPIKRVLLKTFSIPTGQMSHVQDNLFLSQTPGRIVVGLVDTVAFNGRLNTNPFNFKTCDLSFFGLYSDGKQVPAKPLTPDFTRGQFVRSYHGMMTALGFTNADRGNSLSYR